MIELTPEKLLESRTEKGLSQQEVADFVGIAQRTYSAYEKGTIKPKADKIEKILEVLGLKNSKNEKTIPLLPISAMAGVFSGDVSVMEFEAERYVIPIFKDADFLIPVKGSSMYPKYSSGDIVACKKLESWSFFQYGKVYVIYTDQGPIIKRIRKGKDKDHVLIVSENADRYPPFDLHRSEIKGVAIVIGVIRQE